MSLPSEMTAAVLHAPGDLRIEQVPVPQPGPGEVLIEVGACGICGSDVPRVLTKGTYSFPLIPGHEFAGTVAALGADVDEWDEGDEVAVFPLIPCGECEGCGLKAWEVCDDYDYLGSRSNGAFAEYVVAPAWNLIEVPEGVSMEEAAMAEPAAVARHAVRRGGIFEEDSIAVFGAGPIGVMVMQWADVERAEPQWLIDIVPEKLEFAREVTMATRINAAQADPVAAIREATDGLGVDLAIEAAGVPTTVRQCLDVAACFGRVVLLGNPSADLTLPKDEVSQILRKQLDIHGTWNSSFKGPGCDDWFDALMAMEAGLLDLEPLITHRYPIDQANEAFAMMSGNREFYSKVMLVFG